MRIGDFKRKSRIIVVDDNYDHASGIRELINLENDYEVIANAANVNIAVALIKKYQPDLVLMDMNMPEIDGITGIAEVEKLGLGTKVIALTGYDDPDLIFRAMKLGAKGYILKTMASHQLIHALDEVTAGKIYLPNSLVSKFFQYFQDFEKNPNMQNQDDEENLLNYLTSREEEVLELLTNGITYKGVAAKLFISETTVKTHVNNIFQKLQVNDRTQAVLYAINKGFTNRRKIAI
ncbi:response regulator transcription factor [bacterium]|nr:response regulator transcription factor [bacterium]